MKLNKTTQETIRCLLLANAAIRLLDDRGYSLSDAALGIARSYEREAHELWVASGCADVATATIAALVGADAYIVHRLLQGRKYSPYQEAAIRDVFSPEASDLLVAGKLPANWCSVDQDLLDTTLRYAAQDYFPQPPRSANQTK